ncbi:MAG TPA: ammonia channel protein, partial [Phenylobacterium sp.]|nr:ammonia channel protein [Phenylobacterium sp.]
MMPIKLNRLAGLMLAAALMGAPAASAWAQEAPPPAEAAAPIAEAAPTGEVVTEEAVVEEVVEEEVATVDSGDTAWMLTSTALVLMMTIPGLALFYGGMVRKKNVISTVAQSFAITAVMSVLWMVVGYSLAFSENGNAALNPFVGGLGNAFLSGVAYDGVSGSIPEYLFVVFQMTFFIITPALITGAFAERMKFSAMLLFSVLWALLVYAPVCHWVWGGGFLSEEGVLDFAGGTVVHINAGVAGLVCAIVLGKRKGYGTDN